MSIRPLIKASNIQTETYLSNTPTYTVAETARIKKYLPKLMTFVGVDSHDHQEALKQELSKQKLKLKAVQGQQIQSKLNLAFLQSNELNIKIWNDVAICLNIPFNNRQNAEDEKDQIDSKIQAFIDRQLYFINKQGKLISQTQMVSLDNFEVFFNPTELSAQTFDNNYRQIRFSLAVGVMLLKKQTYTIKEISDAIKNDILSSLKIMIKNKLPIRILRSAISQERVLILQSFVSKFQEIDAESKKLNELLNKPYHNKKTKEQQAIIEQESQNEANPVNPKKQLTNRQLLLILLGLFFIYLFLKINPIQKILSQSL